MGLALKVAPYKGWQHCLHASNGRLKLIASLDVGPRLLHFGFEGGPNELYEARGDAGKRGGPQWRFYGGHRLWVAPEKAPYVPDNAPVAWEPLPNGFRLTQRPERSSGLQKQLDFKLKPGAARVQVIHRLFNRSRQTRRWAPWAMTVLKAGGKIIVPFPPRISFPKQLLPSSALALWPYTDLSDPRWSFGPQGLLFTAQASRQAPQKLGAYVPNGWAAYARGRHLFVKAFKPGPKEGLSDFMANVELWGRGPMVELETLGPVATLRPGASVEHEERWALLDGFSVPKNVDDAWKRLVPKMKPLVRNF